MGVVGGQTKRSATWLYGIRIGDSWFDDINGSWRLLRHFKSVAKRNKHFFLRKWEYLLINKERYCVDVMKRDLKYMDETKRKW